MSNLVQSKTSVPSKVMKVHVPKKRGRVKQFLLEGAAVLLTLLIFGIPFYFVIINALKNTKEAAMLNMALPTSVHFIENAKAVFAAQDGIIFTAFFNSLIITGFSIAILILVGSMAGFVLQRKRTKVTPLLNFLVLAGLIIPPAIVPTIWVLNSLGLFKTFQGIILIQVALNLPFTILLYKGFMATVPREIEEAALIDGCGKVRLFFKIILPLLKPVTSTVVILTGVGIYNDFVNPLYFFPGAENATLQLTLYNFTSMYNTQWNLLFFNILVITIPMLILFLIFNKKIVAGMAAGAVK
jgi:raffinose/stachyose/melibiose transport system permease protein